MISEEKEKRKQERKEVMRIAKKLQKTEEEKNQSPVKKLHIVIEWKKSRTWGYNPHAEVLVDFKNERYIRKEGYTCSGCGYDKESTIIADIFNDFLKYKLYQEDILNKKDKPYGFYCTEDYKLYNGGVGTSCYYRISEFIGGKFICIASGKTFDVFEYSEE